MIHETIISFSNELGKVNKSILGHIKKMVEKNNKELIVVVIDDDKFQLKLIIHQLKSAGIVNITTYTSAVEALNDIADINSPETIIFLDLNMPSMDGIEFISLLNDAEYIGALILLSGENERILESTSRLAISYDLNILGHIVKPLKQFQLDRLLKEYKFYKKTKTSSFKKKIIYSTNRLRQALELDELFTVYQPKINLRTRELESIETLVRWAHPDDGIVFPDQFISLAEEAKLIKQLTLYVIDRALKDMKIWKEEGISVIIAINVSMDDLSDRSFIKEVETRLLKYNVKADELILEVTESKLMEEYSTSLNILTSLRLRKIGLSIDDFGTGHSSMVQLRDIPFTELKLDRSFVHGAWKDKTLYTIFKASQQLAQNMNIKMVAEGVEDVDDWEFLIKEECDYAQGYYIAKPMLPHLLKKWSMDWEKKMKDITL